MIMKKITKKTLAKIEQFLNVDEGREGLNKIANEDSETLKAIKRMKDISWEALNTPYNI